MISQFFMNFLVVGSLQLFSLMPIVPASVSVRRINVVFVVTAGRQRLVNTILLSVVGTLVVREVWIPQHQLDFAETRAGNHVLQFLPVLSLREHLLHLNLLQLQVCIAIEADRLDEVARGLWRANKITVPVYFLQVAVALHGLDERVRDPLTILLFHVAVRYVECGQLLALEQQLTELVDGTIQTDVVLHDE